MPKITRKGGESAASQAADPLLFDREVIRRQTMGSVKIRNEYGECICAAYWDPGIRDVVFETRYRGNSRRIKLSDVVRQLRFYRLLK